MTAGNFYTDAQLSALSTIALGGSAKPAHKDASGWHGTVRRDAGQLAWYVDSKDEFLNANTVKSLLRRKAIYRTSGCSSDGPRTYDHDLAGALWLDAAGAEALMVAVCTKTLPYVKNIMEAAGRIK